MREPTDALRSVQVYAAASLGSEWEVRLTAEEGAFHRPFCRVNRSTPVSFRNQGPYVVDLFQTFTLVCYPKEKSTPDEALLEAARVERLLFIAFGVGTHEPSFGATFGIGPTIVARRGHPRRVPLYDFTGIALDEAVPETARNSRDFLRVVEDPAINTFQDPADDLIYTTVCDIRMSWGAFAGVPSAGVTVESITAEADSNG